MPHFTIHCSQPLLHQHAANTIMNNIHEIAVASGLFNEQDIKVRILPFEHYLRAGVQQDFFNIFAEIMEGRTTEQKAKLSEALIQAMHQLFPEVPMAMSIRDIEKATYFNARWI
ncbi:MAG: 5-carboxymethyl-2-hydroxymuconate Delta-isomerase [Flammeovirgaceae bacterium]